MDQDDEMAQSGSMEKSRRPRRQVRQFGDENHFWNCAKFLLQRLIIPRCLNETPPASNDDDMKWGEEEVRFGEWYFLCHGMLQVSAPEEDTSEVSGEVRVPEPDDTEWFVSDP